MGKKSEQGKAVNQKAAKAAGLGAKIKAAFTTAQKPVDQKPLFAINKIYLKDASIRSPGAPSVFKFKGKLSSEVAVNLSNHRLPESGVYEVIVGATAIFKADGKAAAMIRAAQAGIFTVSNVAPLQRQEILGKMCPDILLPYVRDKLLNMAVSAGFPPIYLTRGNFAALLARSAQAAAQKKSA